MQRQSSVSSSGAFAPPTRLIAPAWAALVALAAGVFVALIVAFSGWGERPRPPQAPAGALQVERPTVKAGRDRIDVTVTVTSDQDRTLRGWFFLSRPNEPEPWQRFDYKSAEITQDVTAGKTTFRWSEPISLPNDEYEITVWFHQRNGDKFEHAAGGAFGADSVYIRGSRARAHQIFGRAAASLAVPELSYFNGTLRALVEVTGAEGVAQANLAWELQPAGRTAEKPAFSGPVQPLRFGENGRRLVSVRLEATPTLASGRYDLWLIVDGGADRPMQRAVVRGAVTQP